MSTLNVKDYGARGDGTTDDTRAIQDAIDDATDGDTVYIPATDDYYRVTQQVEIRDGDLYSAFEFRDRHTGFAFSIEGDGPDSEIRLDGFAQAVFQFYMAEADPDKFDVSFYDLVIDGGGADNADGIWIHNYGGGPDVSLGHNWVVEDVRFQNGSSAISANSGSANQGFQTFTGRRIDAINMQGHAFSINWFQEYADINGPEDIQSTMKSVYLENTGNQDSGRNSFNISGSMVVEDFYATDGNERNKMSSDNSYAYFKNGVFDNYNGGSDGSGVWYDTVGGGGADGDKGYTLDFDTVAIRNIDKRGAIRTGSNDRGEFIASGPVEFNNVNSYGIRGRFSTQGQVSYGEIRMIDLPNTYYDELDDTGEADLVEHESVGGTIVGGGWDVDTVNETSVEPLDTPGPDDVGAWTGDASEDDTSDGDASEDDTSGESEPLFDEWTPRWDSSIEDWEVVSGSTFDGDHALTFEHDGGDPSRYALSCDGIGDPSNVEVLDKFRVPEFTDDPDLGFHARVHLRSSYGSDDHDGYWVSTDDADEAFRLGKYTGGDLTTLGLFGTPTEDTFYYRRFRAEGSEIKAKVWETTEPEPTEWDIEVTDSEHVDGWVGLGSYDTGRVETDVFSVATGGDSANIPGLDDQPTASWQAPTDGNTVSDTLHVQIEASSPGDPDGSLEVEYRIDQGSWSTTEYDSETGYYEAEWDTVAMEDGEYTLTARVTDSDGNDAETAIDVIVENPVEIGTVEARDVSDRSGILVGEMVSLGGASSAEVGFEWREDGASDWATTERRSVSSVGEFSVDVDGLEEGTDYEFRAVVYLPEEVEAEVRSFSTELPDDDEDAAPVIDKFDVRDRSNPAWSRFEVDWTVSHPDGDLDAVITKLRYNGSVVAAESTTVSGGTDSYTHVMRVQGDVDEAVLSVNDTENTVTTEIKDV